MTFIERRQTELIKELRSELKRIKLELQSMLANKVEIERRVLDLSQRLHYGKPGT